MKKLIKLLLIFTLIFSIVACSSPKDNNKKDDSTDKTTETEKNDSSSDDSSATDSEEDTNQQNNKPTNTNGTKENINDKGNSKNESNNNLDYIQPTITANKTNISLVNKSETIYITMTGGESVTCDITNANIVDCGWGDWNGDTIPLTFYPVSSGNTSVKVKIDGHDKSITINVTVHMSTPAELTTLTIQGVGSEFNQYNNGLPNIIKLHSATHRKDNYPNDTVAIWVDFIVSCTECADYNGYIQLRYNLYNSSGVVVNTGTTITEFTHTHTQYYDTIVFSDLPPDNYTLVFSDKY